MGVYKRKNIYYIDYHFRGKRIRERIGTNRKLAELTLSKIKVEIAENKYLDKRKQKKIKFEDFAETFLEDYSKNNKKSWKTDFYHLKRLKTVFGKMYLFNITPKDIEEFKKMRKKDVSFATVNREIATLKTMFNKAIEWGNLDNNPAKNVKFFKEDNARLRHLEKAEILKLIACCSSYLRPIVILALNTGMRKGEILGLKWRDIDFKRGIIYLLNTKNGEKREVPLNDFAKRTLIQVRRHPDSPYVFCKKDGNPYKDIRKSFFTSLQKAGIMNFKFHDLRHSFASQLVMAGIDLNTVRELLGHKDIRMTLRYAHLSLGHKQKAVEILGRCMVTKQSQMPKVEIEQKDYILQHIGN